NLGGCRLWGEGDNTERTTWTGSRRVILRASSPSPVTRCCGWRRCSPRTRSRRPNSGPPCSPPSASGPTTTRLTAAQTALYKLSKAAAKAPARPGGRYVIMTEKQDTYARTSVLDSLTGDVWTYQQGAEVPSELPVARHDSPTAAQFD